MKVSQVLKSVAVAAAFVAAAPAFSASVVTNGAFKYSLDTTKSTGALVFSADALSTLSLVGITVSAGGTTTQSTTTTAGDTVTQGTTDWTLTNNNVTSLSFIGSIVNLTRAGSTIKLSDFSFDVTNKVLNGKIIVGATTSSLGIFNAASISGQTFADTSILNTPQTINNTVSGLKLTDAAVNVLGDALGVPALFRPALAAVDFGVLNAKTTGTVTAVPEPSTYALMGLGLAAAGFIARRKSA